MNANASRTALAAAPSPERATTFVLPLTSADLTIASDILRETARMRREGCLGAASLCWQAEELERLAMFAVDAKRKLEAGAGAEAGLYDVAAQAIRDAREAALADGMTTDEEWTGFAAELICERFRSAGARPAGTRQHGDCASGNCYTCELDRASSGTPTP